MAARAVTKIICLTTVSVGLTWDVSGQSFVNLGFENARLTGFLENAYENYYVTNATVPGWNWSPASSFGFGDPTTTVPYNAIALDSAAVTLQGTNSPYFSALQDKYSILLQGASYNAAYGAMIQQTGQIPAGSESMTYWSLGAPQVTFNGQLLSFIAISNTPNYTIWGADVSAYAGQTGPLTFAVPGQSGALIDNIQFSSTPVPEPNASSLLRSGFKNTFCKLL